MPFVARATATTQNQAYDLARRRLLVALLDDESQLQEGPYSNQLLLAVHDPEHDPIEQGTGSEGVEVEVGLREDGVGPALSRLEATLAHVELSQVPSALRPTIQDFRTFRLKRLICRRKNDLLDNHPLDNHPLDNHPLDNAECAPSSGRQDEAGRPGEADRRVEADLNAMLARITLLPKYDGGLPTSQGRYLRPLRVRALLDGDERRPLAGLPLLLTLGSDERIEELRTDKQGELTFEIPQETGLDATFQIEVDLRRLLGAEGSEKKLAPISLRSRNVGLARSALLLASEDAAPVLVGRSTSQALSDLLTRRVELNDRQIALFRRASKNQMSDVLQQLADAHEGKLDTVLFLEAESEFASRMGTHRVWFEARGKLTTFDVWTGNVVFEIESAVTESGVGDARAEEAARQSLGRDLASKLRKAWSQRLQNTRTSASSRSSLLPAAAQ